MLTHLLLGTHCYLAALLGFVCRLTYLTWVHSVLCGDNVGVGEIISGEVWFAMHICLLVVEIAQKIQRKILSSVG